MRDNRSDSGVGLGGFLAGLAVGAVAAFLMDEKNRRMIQKAGHDLRDRAEDKIEEVEEGVEKAKDRTKKELSRNLKEASRRLDNGAARVRA